MLAVMVFLHRRRRDSELKPNEGLLRNNRRLQATVDKYLSMPVLLEGSIWKRRNGMGKVRTRRAWQMRRFELKGTVLWYYPHCDGDDQDDDEEEQIFISGLDATKHGESKDDDDYSVDGSVRSVSARPVNNRPRGFLDLSQEYTHVHASRGHLTGAPSPFCLSIVVNDQVKWKLAFDDQPTMMQWLNALSNVVVQRGVDDYNVALLKAIAANKKKEANNPSSNQGAAAAATKQAATNNSTGREALFLRRRSRRPVYEPQSYNKSETISTHHQLWLTEDYTVLSTLAAVKIGPQTVSLPQSSELEMAKRKHRLELQQRETAYQNRVQELQQKIVELTKVSAESGARHNKQVQALQQEVLQFSRIARHGSAGEEKEEIDDDESDDESDGEDGPGSEAKVTKKAVSAADPTEKVDAEKPVVAEAKKSIKAKGKKAGKKEKLGVAAEESKMSKNSIKANGKKAGKKEKLGAAAEESKMSKKSTKAKCKKANKKEKLGAAAEESKISSDDKAEVSTTLLPDDSERSIKSRTGVNAEKKKKVVEARAVVEAGRRAEEEEIAKEQTARKVLTSKVDFASCNQQSSEKQTDNVADLPAVGSPSASPTKKGEHKAHRPQPQKMKPWSCEVCTFCNDNPTLMCCDLCGSLRPTLPGEDIEATFNKQLEKAENMSAVEAARIAEEKRHAAECAAKEQQARLEAEERAAAEKVEAEAKAKQESDELTARLEAEAQTKKVETAARKAEEERLAAELAVKEEKFRLEAEERAAAEKTRLEAEAKAKKEAVELAARLEAEEEQARLEAEERAAAEKTRLEAEAEANAKKEAAELVARLEAEAMVKKEAEEAAAAAEIASKAEEEGLAAELATKEEQAKLEAEEKTAAEKARLEAEAKAKKDAAQLAARLEAEAKAKKEDEEAAAAAEIARKAEEEPLAAELVAKEEQGRLEVEERAAAELVENARLEAEARANKEADELAARLEAEAKAKKEAEEVAAAEAARKAEEVVAELAAKEEQARLEADERAAAELAEKARQETEEQTKQEAAELAARLEAEANAKKEAEEAAASEAAEAARLAAQEERLAAEVAAKKEKSKLDAEELAAAELAEKARLKAEEQAKMEAADRYKQESASSSRFANPYATTSKHSTEDSNAPSSRFANTCAATAKKEAADLAASLEAESKTKKEIVNLAAALEEAATKLAEEEQHNAEVAAKEEQSILEAEVKAAAQLADEADAKATKKADKAATAEAPQTVAEPAANDESATLDAEGKADEAITVKSMEREVQHHLDEPVREQPREAWRCKVCTFLNVNPLFMCCEMCSSQRIGTPKSPSVTQSTQQVTKEKDNAIDATKGASEDGFIGSIAAKITNEQEEAAQEADGTQCSPMLLTPLSVDSASPNPKPTGPFEVVFDDDASIYKKWEELSQRWKSAAGSAAGSTAVVSGERRSSGTDPFGSPEHMKDFFDDITSKMDEAVDNLLLEMNDDTPREKIRIKLPREVSMDMTDDTSSVTSELTRMDEDE